MDRPYVEWVRVENFRCIHSVDLHLTPLHALIGPNDSGKSSLLRAIERGPLTSQIINELKPEEVTIVTRKPETGRSARR